MKIHANLKYYYFIKRPFLCKQCHRCFARYRILKIHQKIHFMENAEENTHPGKIKAKKVSSENKEVI
jgi:hypothetical protein